MGRGVTAGNMTNDTDQMMTNQCSTPQCHDTNGLASKDPVAYDDPVATLVGGWKAKDR